jgi:hypothetical protein
MRHSKAIVTITIGSKYLETWKILCEANWQQYAEMHGYDLICIDRPLDTSDRAKGRSPAWQKCLILSQDFSREYERIVWIDSDILINTDCAPSIIAGVPDHKVGAVAAYSTPTRQLFLQALDRCYRYYESRDVRVVRQCTPEEYYKSYGFPASPYDEVVQSGVLVLSPKYHRDVLERTYIHYESKNGPEWAGSDAWSEMPPLSYELLTAKLVHWIDHRFNQGWIPYQLMHYPFLATAGPTRSFARAVRQRAAKLFGFPTELELRRACVTAAFLSNFALHFAGDKSDMPLVDVDARSWTDCTLW